MIKRKFLHHKIDAALARQAAVALIGPRQVGKTTLALHFAKHRSAVYLDLESRTDRDKLTNPELFFNLHPDKLIILDEIHHMPELFQVLRGVIDNNRRRGHRYGQFLILGSASIELLRQSGESLAGRIEYIDIAPLNVSEIDNNSQSISRLWLRGGFPDSYLARTDADSFHLRSNFIRTYLERDIPQFGSRIPADTLGRFWTMLAHSQGTLLNASRLATALSVSAPTITSYIGLLVDLLLVRKLPPYHININKRLVKSPKTYVCDSGLLHALLGIRDVTELMGHPVAGVSWEGFVIENILSVLPVMTKTSFYRTAVGAEMDLILELGGNHGKWAIEIKQSLTAKPTRGFYQAREDVEPNKTFIVYAGEETYPLSEEIEVISLSKLLQKIIELR